MVPSEVKSEIGRLASWQRHHEERCATIQDWLTGYRRYLGWREAELGMGPDVIAGKNETERKARFAMTMSHDPEHESLAQKVQKAERVLALAEAHLHATQAEIRLTDAWLRGRAG